MSTQAKDSFCVCFCDRKGRHENASDDEKSICQSATLKVIRKWLPQDLPDSDLEAKKEYERILLHFQTFSSLGQFTNVYRPPSCSNLIFVCQKNDI
jgi:hypothetical protein